MASVKRRRKRAVRVALQRSGGAPCARSTRTLIPKLLLQAEREAASAVLCPIHGERSSGFAGPLIYGEINPLPTHLNPNWRTWHSLQYAKAMDASFPPDRWPATKIVESDGTVGFVLKDGTEILRLDPPPEILDYNPPPR
jgi:hypothetical protein